MSLEPEKARGDLGAPHLVSESGMDIASYYAAAAPHYDQLRFGGSYGKYLDAQERGVLRAWLAGRGRVLDLGCGTGRLLDLATDGADRSPEMLARARARHPGRLLARALSTHTPFPDAAFDAIFSMHLFMHLPKEEIARTLDECRRLLRPGGILAFDVPGQPRRDLTGFRPAGWHCATAYQPEELRGAARGWIWRELRGLLAFPAHRLPERLRPIFRPLDTALGRSPLRRWCSYYLVRLEKPAA